jgi:ribosomal protein S18 acetylase RimI-like enzyme
MSILVRPVTPEDYVWIFDTIKVWRQEVGKTDPFTFENISNTHQDPRTTALIYILNGVRVGFVAALDQQSFKITALIVHEKYRRTGIGKYLMREILKRKPSHQIAVVTIKTTSSRFTSLKKFCESLGFRLVWDASLKDFDVVTFQLQP